jgi:hypothetical protein
MSTKDAFFDALEDHGTNLLDNNLRESVVIFFATWPHQRSPVFEDIRTNPRVSEAAARFLPASVCLREWIERRMYEDMELDDASVPENEDEWIINLTFKGAFKVQVYKGGRATAHDDEMPRATTDQRHSRR